MADTRKYTAPHDEAKLAAGDGKARRAFVIGALKEQGNRCYLCDRHMVIVRGTNGILPAHAATIDHIVPLSGGGGWGRDNLALACRECNQRKGAHATPTRKRTERKQERQHRRLTRKFAEFQARIHCGIPLRGGWL